MKREKIISLKKEFPFLTEILSTTGFDPSVGQVKIARLDTAFLSSVPVDESYDSSAGSSRRYERLFAIRGEKLDEIALEPAQDHSTGYAYDRAHRTEGQTILSSLIEAGCLEFDFLVHYQYSSCSWQEGYDEDCLTILKPMKGMTISEAWANALREAERKIKEEVMSVDDLNTRLQKYLNS